MATEVVQAVVVQILAHKQAAAVVEMVEAGKAEAAQVKQSKMSKAASTKEQRWPETKEKELRQHLKLPGGQEHRRRGGRAGSSGRPA